MLSYLHAFHAGNYADVQKHAALTLALDMMKAKSSAIACFDTHAGSGRYDLASERARKTGEADGGIQRVWMQRNRLESADWQPMLRVLDGLNQGSGALACYAGSPEWFMRSLRSQDSLTLFELHSSEGEQLASTVSGRSARVCREDGLKGLLKALPPKAPRLLVLMDPSYEIKQDYGAVAQTLEKAWRLCRHGVFLVWYPILTDGHERTLLEAMRGGAVRKVLRNEVRLTHPPARGMVGTGMLVVNPPWQFAERLETMLAEVCTPECLDATMSQDWLVPE
ncbi:23S rRNA (adenine(2030)-N(6))-methyltransferase RlmJ [Marinobacter zhejiangensis]|uniref:Ribosomal RNA large subunit methyltransferase J n=1 Tax=Marinobacter zhejiangensis TaxID=488535 RepID=A0A1I4QEA1_9GAMM|nr:23S rRNA (adenine(2030)-N(6))-methyltransferase RlmJ [Marinobacter zhejiangensis]SFM38442.1 23S rRNA (adenine2030-N6)-methyltransferase [Marinobacter zhejiangensis]